jgi:hypothetical protein
MGHRQVPDSFSKSVDGSVGKNLAAVAGVGAYPGDATEAGNAVYQCVQDRSVQLEILSALGLSLDGPLYPSIDMLDVD